MTMMRMASSPVTDKDIMREFVTVAASEAASSIKNKPPSAVLGGDRKHDGGPGAGAAPGAVGEAASEGNVDDARPTGYRYTLIVDSGLAYVVGICLLTCLF